MPVSFELSAVVGCASILPNDGIVERFARVAVPHEGGFALIGDAQRGNGVGAKACCLQHFRKGGALTGPDFSWIVFDPTRLGVDLLECLLGSGYDLAGVIEEYGSGARGSLVQGENVVFRGHGIAGQGRDPNVISMQIV